MKTLLSRVFKPIQLFFSALDRSLVYLATPFGVHVKEPGRRYAILLGIYAIIYLLGLLPIPVVPLVALTYGYIGVLAVGRAWVLNEKERALVAKKLKDGNPDDMPDLRWTALVSGLQLVILFPLIFQQVQWHFDLFTLPADADVWTWFGFTLDSYNKSVLNLFEIYGVHINHVDYNSTWGRHLTTLCRLTIDFILIQGVFRLWAIRETIFDAVAAVGNDLDLAVRIGSRAVAPLISKLQDMNKGVRRNVAVALGKLHDPRAVAPLIVALQDTDIDVRYYVVEALALINDPRAVEPLIAALAWEKELHEHNMNLGQQVAEVLGNFRDSRAVEPLIRVLEDPESRVRSSAAKALGNFRDSRAVAALIHVLQDPESGVPHAAAEVLGRMNDSRAVEPLIAALQRADGSVRERCAKALGELKDPRAVEPLIAALEDVDGDVRQNAAEALGELNDSRAIGPLIHVLQDSSVAGRMDDSGAYNSWALGPLPVQPFLFRRIAVAALGNLKNSQAFHPLVAALQDADWPVREKAAWVLGKLGDLRAVEPLIAALNDTEARVRQSAAEAMGELAAVEPLVSALEATNADVRKTAADALHNLNDPVSTQPMMAAVPDAKNGFRSNGLDNLSDSREAEVSNDEKLGGPISPGEIAENSRPDVAEGGGKIANFPSKQIAAKIAKIKLNCPNCKSLLQVPPSAAGKKVRCPKAECKKQFLVPTADTAGSK